jgi:hypothetical protein
VISFIGRKAGYESIMLYPGLNLMGYPNLRPMVIPDYLDTVFMYDNTWRLFFKGKSHQDLQYFQPGHGYWVDVSEQLNITLDG